MQTSTKSFLVSKNTYGSRLSRKMKTHWTSPSTPAAVRERLKTDPEYREWMRKCLHNQRVHRNQLFGWSEFKRLMKEHGSETPYHSMGHTFGGNYKDMGGDVEKERDNSLQCGTCGTWFYDHQERPVPCVNPMDLTAKGKASYGRYAKQKERGSDD